MKQYSTINWYEKDTNEVFDFMYNELEEEEQYPFFLFLMQHFPNLEIDWLETFEDFTVALIQNDKTDTILSFIEWYKLKYPEDYREKYEFIERDLCDYFFYKKEVEKLQERVAFIQQNPVSAIDTLTARLHYQLIYHGYYEQAVCYAEAVWTPINDSEELIGFAAYPFINTIYVNQLQKYYEAVLNGIYFDEDKLFHQMVTMGFEDDKINFNEALGALKEELSLTDIKNSIQNGNDKHMIILNVHFLKYMLHTYQLPFVFSEWIWNFIATTKIFGKHKGVENWFYIDAKTLDKHIADNLDSFLGSNELEIFGKVWGLDFVFDFFTSTAIIVFEHFESMLENISYFRNEMLRVASGNLWQMMFVFNWPSTNDYLVDPSAQQLFNETYGIDETEAIEKVSRHLFVYSIPDRLKKELKLKDSNKSNPFPIWSENTPYKKQEPETGRNRLCPCGSGKKFKKCCMNT
ncbi:MAG: SEC-C domain-containing protein [Bacteroidetes bacterium]|nr:SEC-C domain-containing protein [Bacteroidota bacterium]